MCFSCLRFSFGGAGLNRRWGGYLDKYQEMAISHCTSLTLQIVSGYHSAIEETGTRTKKTCFLVLHVLI
uniref:Uncharacterized protein n=1 Tax=Populus trichocarpa TaxID=3694 RepID=U5GRX2_POPTR